MKKTTIIITSALIIGIFTTLFLVEQSDNPPGSEVEASIDTFKGNPGFVIVSLPRFLLNEIIPGDNFEEIKKNNSIHKTKVLIYQEAKSKEYTQELLYNHILHNLDSLKFEQINTPAADSVNKQVRTIFQKEKDGDWSESVFIFTSDSSLFLFDFITKLKREKIRALADSIDPEKINFNY